MESKELNEHVEGLTQQWQRGNHDSVWFQLAVMAVRILWNIEQSLKRISRIK